MSYPFAAGDKLPAADINEAFRLKQQTFVYGETISAGDALYLKDSDGRVWKASSAALNEAMFSFVGIALEAGTAGQTKRVAIEGLVTGLSLTALSATIAEADDISQTNVSGGTVAFDSTGYFIRQWFSTGATVGNMTALSLYLDKQGTPGQSLTASIYEMGTDGRETGAALGSVTFANADVSGAGFVKKTFSSAITLKPRTMYVMKVVYGTYTATNYFRMYYANTDVINTARGNRMRSVDSSPSVSGDAHAFKTHYTETRNAYYMDKVYLNDSSGSYGYNEGTQVMPIGRVVSATSVLLTSPTSEVLIKKYGYTLQSGVFGGSGGAVMFPIGRNVRKVLITQQINDTNPKSTTQWTAYVKDLITGGPQDFNQTGGAAYGFSVSVVSTYFIRLDWSTPYQGAGQLTVQEYT